MRSPVLNINRACQTCHRWPEEELKARVETIQERTFQLRNTAMEALVEFVDDIRAARPRAVLTKNWQLRATSNAKAQFHLDFIEAENSMGFHAPQEAARVLGQSIEFTRRGQRSLIKEHPKVSE